MLASVVISKPEINANLRLKVSKWFGRVADSFSESDQNQTPLLLLTYMLLLCVPLLLYTFRSYDDNRLISWYWSFSQEQLFYMLAVLSVALAFLWVVVKAQWQAQENIINLTVISFLVTIPFWQTPEVIIDNARYFTQAKHMELYGVGYFFREWGGNIFAWTDLPLIPFIYGLSFQVFGEHRSVIQALGGLFFAGTVVMTYGIGKLLWSHDHGIAASALLLGFPYLYTQIPLMMVDIPTMFFLSLAVFATVLAVKEGGHGYILGASVAIVLALFTKYSVWIFMSVLPVVVVAQPRAAWRDSLFRLCKIGFLVVALLAASLFWYYPMFIEQFNILFNYQWGALDRWQESNVSTFLFHIHPLISAAALVSIFIAIKNRDKQFWIISAMLLPIVFMDLQRIRYLLVVFPMLALMAGYALVKIPSLPLKRMVICGIVLTSYGVALSLSGGFLQNTSANNLKSAGAYLDTMDVDSVDVMVLPQQRSIINPQITVPILDYHTDKTLVLIDRWRINKPKDMSAISRSPVRFTWENPIPIYYDDSHSMDFRKKALAVVYSDKEQMTSAELVNKLADYRLVKQFQSATEVFKFKTLVNLYVPN